MPRSHRVTPCEKLIEILKGYGYTTDHIQCAQGAYRNKSVDGVARWNCFAEITDPNHPRFGVTVSLSGWATVGACIQTRNWELDIRPDNHPVSVNSYDVDLKRRNLSYE